MKCLFVQFEDIEENLPEEYQVGYEVDERTDITNMIYQLGYSFS